MPLNQRGEVGEINNIERIEPLSSGPLQQIANTTSSTDAEQVDSNDVPDGHAVVVQALDDNTGPVYIGDSDTQEWALEARESIETHPPNTDEIHVQTPNRGDGIVVMWRGS